MKILLVDDEIEFVSTLAERLSMRGYDTTWCSTPSEATQLAQEGSFDLAVLDVKMPGASGIELRTSLQAISPSMHYIFITGHGSESDFSVGKESGASYLGKPVDINELIAIVDTISKKINATES